jgi:hypothetical protein
MATEFGSVNKLIGNAYVKPNKKNKGPASLMGQAYEAFKDNTNVGTYSQGDSVGIFFKNIVGHGAKEINKALKANVSYIRTDAPSQLNKMSDTSKAQRSKLINLMESKGYTQSPTDGGLWVHPELARHNKVKEGKVGDFEPSKGKSKRAQVEEAARKKAEREKQVRQAQSGTSTPAGKNALDEKFNVFELDDKFEKFYKSLSKAEQAKITTYRQLNTAYMKSITRPNPPKKPKGQSAADAKQDAQNRRRSYRKKGDGGGDSGFIGTADNPNNRDAELAYNPDELGIPVETTEQTLNPKGKKKNKKK